MSGGERAVEFRGGVDVLRVWMLVLMKRADEVEVWAGVAGLFVCGVLSRAVWPRNSLLVLLVLLLLTFLSFSLPRWLGKWSFAEPESLGLNEDRRRMLIFVLRLVNGFCGLGIFGVVMDVTLRQLRI